MKYALVILKLNLPCLHQWRHREVLLRSGIDLDILLTPLSWFRDGTYGVKPINIE